MWPLLPTFAFIALALITAQLVWLGFRDADREDDPCLSICLEPTPAGTWVGLRIENPGPAVALAGARIRRARRFAAAFERRGAGRRAHVPLTEQVIAVVGAESRETLWLFAEGEPSRLELVTTVGLPGRLRFHRARLDRSTERVLGPARFPSLRGLV